MKEIECFHIALDVVQNYLISRLHKDDMYTRTIGDTASEEVKSENGKPRVSEQKPSLLELLTRAGAGSSARSVVKACTNELSLCVHG